MEIPGYYFWEWPESPWAKQRTTGAPRHPGNDQFFTTGSFAIPRDFLFYPRNRFTPKRPISHRITPNEKHHPRPPPRTMTRNNTNDTRPTMRMTTRTTARMTAGLPVPTEPKIANANDDANDKTNESTKGNTSDGADDDRTTARPGCYDDDGSVGHVSGGSDSERAACTASTPPPFSTAAHDDGSSARRWQGNSIVSSAACATSSSGLERARGWAATTARAGARWRPPDEYPAGSVISLHVENGSPAVAGYACASGYDAGPAAYAALALLPLPAGTVRPLDAGVALVPRRLHACVEHEGWRMDGHFRHVQ
ncbi:hypothetical protein BJ912DRAFT_932516 [Pholiota molesta]|nr:hypothetical protein BJ912DRAFT_932516 [Pholiota molesta]